MVEGSVEYGQRPVNLTIKFVDKLKTWWKRKIKKKGPTQCNKHVWLKTIINVKLTLKKTFKGQRMLSMMHCETKHKSRISFDKY